MRKIELSFGCSTVTRIKPLLDGTVQPEGIKLIPSVIPPDDLFWRIPHHDPFDIAELSLTGYLWGVQHGKQWTAIPVFPAWVFGCHAETLINVDAGIDRPEDLKGKRIGVPEYPVTAILWIRHALETEYGVKPQDICWCEERSDRFSHYKLMGYRPPPDVCVEVIPEEKLLCDMLVSGELDAVTRYFGKPRAYAPPILVDRSNKSMIQLAQHPKVRWLYPNRKTVAIDYHRKIGHLQPVHCVIVKQHIIEKFPWVTLNLMDAFAKAAHLTAKSGYPRSVHPERFKLTKAEELQVVGSDFWPVGLSKNQRAMEHFLELAYEQGYVTGRRFTVEQFFDANCLYT